LKTSASSEAPGRCTASDSTRLGRPMLGVRKQGCMCTGAGGEKQSVQAGHENAEAAGSRTRASCSARRCRTSPTPPHRTDAASLVGGSRSRGMPISGMWWAKRTHAVPLRAGRDESQRAAPGARQRGKSQLRKVRLSSRPQSTAPESKLGPPAAVQEAAIALRSARSWIAVCARLSRRRRSGGRVAPSSRSWMVRRAENAASAPAGLRGQVQFSSLHRSRWQNGENLGPVTSSNRFWVTPRQASAVECAKLRRNLALRGARRASVRSGACLVPR